MRGVKYRALTEHIPTFTYTSDRDKWESQIFIPLLMRHGPPPDGVKFYGEAERMHIRTTGARNYVTNLAWDIGKAVFASDLISHYSDRWRRMHALHIKNKFLRWWHEYSD